MSSGKDAVRRTRGRHPLIFVGVSLLPWPAVWIGLNVLHSLVWTFLLYHGLCNLPLVILQRERWMPDVRKPTRTQWLWLAGAAIVLNAMAIVAFITIGDRIVDTRAALLSLQARGFSKEWFVALALYFLTINAVLEELFWRGSVFNNLDEETKPLASPGVIWSSFAFGAWHYLPLRILLRPGLAELSVLGIMVAGEFFAYLYRRTNSIVVPILWHSLVFDLPIIVILGLVLYGRT